MRATVVLSCAIPQAPGRSRALGRCHHLVRGPAPGVTARRTAGLSRTPPPRRAGRPRRPALQAARTPLSVACSLRIGPETECQSAHCSQCATFDDKLCIIGHRKIRLPLLNRPILLLSVPPEGKRISLVTSPSQFVLLPLEAIVMTWRIRSVRKRILLLALVPLLSLFGLYVFATRLTARNAINLARADTLKNATGQPTGTFEGMIQAERLLAVLYLAAPTPENQAKLTAVEQQVGREAAALRGDLMSGATMNNASAPQARAIDTLLAAMKGLPALQNQVNARTISRPAAVAAFNTLVD